MCRVNRGKYAEIGRLIKDILTFLLQVFYRHILVKSGVIKIQEPTVYFLFLKICH